MVMGENEEREGGGSEKGSDRGREEFGGGGELRVREDRVERTDEQELGYVDTVNVRVHYFSDGRLIGHDFGMFELMVLRIVTEYAFGSQWRVTLSE